MINHSGTKEKRKFVKKISRGHSANSEAKLIGCLIMYNEVCAR